MLPGGMLQLKRQLAATLQTFSVLGDRVLRVATVNAVFLLCGLLGALWLRFEEWPSPRLLVTLALVIIPIRLLTFWYFNSLRGWWRYTVARHRLSLREG